MSFITFIKETRAEFRHVVWPTQKHATLATILVIVVSIAIGYYLGMFDWIFSTLLEQYVL